MGTPGLTRISTLIRLSNHLIIPPDRAPLPSLPCFSLPCTLPASYRDFASHPFLVLCPWKENDTQDVPPPVLNTAFPSFSLYTLSLLSLLFKLIRLIRLVTIN